MTLGRGPALASVRYDPPGGFGAGPGFPFDVPAIAAMGTLELEGPVTLLVGENGSGKSTFLEALAIACRLPAVGAARPDRDPTLEAQRRLARHLRLSWRRRSHRGFFLRAEDFFGFQKGLARSRAEHQEEIRRLEREMGDASAWARSLAQGPHRASIADMDRRYGEDPDAASHGEAFLRLFGERLVPGGLFLLDEPEAALSPQSQLAFLTMLREAVDDGGQLVIATHSPILMAIPGALILSFDRTPVAAVPFQELESVALVRDFLASPGRYLRHVWPE